MKNLNEKEWKEVKSEIISQIVRLIKQEQV